MWARQLRTRVAPWPARLVESRGRDDLAAAVARSPFAMIVIDLGNSVRAMLDDLRACDPHTHGALVLVLDPSRQEGVAGLARELGASRVISGQCPPPRIVEILENWCRLCLARRKSAGWLPDAAEDPDWWNEPALAGPRRVDTPIKERKG